MVIGIGAVLALLFVAPWHRREGRTQRRVYAAALLVTALIYVGFAVLGGATPGWWLVEVGGVLLYGALAWWSLERWPVLLPIGWAAHVLWDVLLHGMATPFVPAWYPALCVGFDLVVAVYLLGRMRTGWR
jgi:hypothetical protein